MRMWAPWLEIRLELVPQLRRLVLDVPLHVLVARAEVALLGAGGFLVAPHADDDAIEPMLVEHGLEGVLLERAAALNPGGLAVGEGAAFAQHLLVLADDELEVPVPAEPVAVFDHAGDLVGGVHVDQRERHMAEKGFARQPQQHGGVLADAPQHGEVLELVERFAEDVDGLVFEFGEVVHGCVTA